MHVTTNESSKAKQQPNKLNKQKNKEIKTWRQNQLNICLALIIVVECGDDASMHTTMWHDPNFNLIFFLFVNLKLSLINLKMLAYAPRS